MDVTTEVPEDKASGQLPKSTRINNRLHTFLKTSGCIAVLYKLKAMEILTVISTFLQQTLTYSFRLKSPLDFASTHILES